MGVYKDRTLKSLCGTHTFSGCELGVDGYDVCLFVLDGITYKAAADGDDGYRSYCEDIEISEQKPRFTFPEIKVFCHMMENSKYENNDVLVIRDILNGKTILEVGTKNYDDYYPYCHFQYTPENMSCNNDKLGSQTERRRK